MHARPQRHKLDGLFHWPSDGVRVTRPTRWGNPHKVGDTGSNAEAVRRYRADLLAGRLKVTVTDVQRELRGRDLYCFCGPDEDCHADVLLEVANREG